MEINKLIKEHHQAMIKKGFYDCPECSDRISFYDSCDHCDDTRIDPNKNIGELLMLIVSELGEALEAHRCDRFAFSTLPNFNIDSLMETHKTTDIMFLFEGHVKDTFEDEIADVFLRLFDLCGYLDIEPKIETVSYYQNLKDKNVGYQLLRIVEAITDVYREGFKNSLVEPKVAINRVLFQLKSFCIVHNIPIEKHIHAKMEYNKTRPHKHGKEY